MPALASRSRGGRSRRMVNEINVVPYIDVMLVLLVIFMVTAPLVPPGEIELPTAGASMAKDNKYIEVQVLADGSMRLRSGNTGDPTERSIVQAELESSVRAMQADLGELPVVISGDRAVRYERIIEVLDSLKHMNVGRVGLMVKQGN